jgi:hypothetical protein
MTLGTIRGRRGERLQKERSPDAGRALELKASFLGLPGLVYFPEGV